MKKFVFITGGARSGKSSFALRLAEGLGEQRVYLATAEALDIEMAERIERHRKERGQGWITLEEPKDIANKIRGQRGVVLIDCLTLWITNLIGAGLEDPGILKEAEALAAECAKAGKTVVAVSNEVGLGLVPENALARRFRDLSGHVNQIMARASDEAWFVASGIPIRLK